MRFPSVLALAVALASMIAPAQADDESQFESRRLHQRLDSRIATGYEITPVQLNLRNRNRLLVGLGSYLVNAAGACNDCHTNPPFLDGGDPFKGQTEIINAPQFLAGGRPFGPIISPNITPDENGRPAGLTFEQFESMMQTGRDPDDPSRLMQIMPWNIYNKLTTLDLRAIYEYLAAIPPLPDNAPTVEPQ
jgi:hypothetical protein